MLRKIEIAVLSVFACFAFAAARQLQSLKIVPDPSAVGVRAQSDIVRAEWVQFSEAGSQSLKQEPIDCKVYYALSPAGGDLARYTELAVWEGDANVPAIFSGAAKSKTTQFKPNRQNGRMGPGVYYVIVAGVDGSDTLYSDGFTLMVASTEPASIVSPRADVMRGELVKVVTDLAPVFAWGAVPGVPYYHIVLSDRPFINSDGSPNKGVNIIWQAITPGSRIAYGAPDPSGAVTAAPPPLASGVTYSWMVLNNYGNRPEFTTWDVVSVMDAVAGRFLIAGNAPLKPPAAVAPEDGGEFGAGDRIEFKWNNLDVNAKSYLVNLLRDGSAEDFGMGGMGDFRMGMLAWEASVPRGDRMDELSVTLDAENTLTGGGYAWRVYALDSRGAAYTDSVRSVSRFRYTGAAEGEINITTRERIGGRDLPVGYVELRSEVLSGPAMTPLLFYTDGNGVQKRPFPAGTYRITAVKDGYFTHTVTVTVSGGAVANVPIPMSRPEASVYGRVLAAADSSAVSSAKVTAVSDRGDTVAAVTDGRGGFMFACRAADWTLTAEKSGFRASSPGRVTVRLGDNRDFGSLYLSRSPFALSGAVRNSSGQPVMGARVRVMREGVLVDELASTPQSGAYVFYLNSGTYTVTTEKPGFAMSSRSVAVAGSMTQDLVIREGAVLVSGVITGMSWVAEINRYASAPIASAGVSFAERGAARPDTFTVTADAVFGKFSVSLPKDRDYTVTASAAGFAASGRSNEFDTRDAGDGFSKRYADTLYALASIKARVNGVREGAPIDAIAYDGASGRIVASARITASGRDGGDVCELRNIPDGSGADGKIRIGVGADGYFTRDGYDIFINKGRLSPNAPEYTFDMAAGNKKILFEVGGYAGDGAVKVVSPFNRAIPFTGAPGTVAELNGAGGGAYIVEAVPDDAGRLALSYRGFNVPENVSEYKTELNFPFTHTAGGTADLDENGKVRIQWPANVVGVAERIDVYYRSEGSVRFESDSTDDISLGALQEFRVKPARDGCNLYYYFRVRLANGDIYGSGNQLYAVYVRPNDKVISRSAVEPGVTDARDTLSMPSSYKAEFTFRAFYSDQFTPITGGFGSVSWSVLDSDGKSVGSGTGMTYSYTTPNVERNLTLQAVLAPSNGYRTRSGAPRDTVRFSIKVTGKPLKSVSVVRNGVAGAILNNERAGFRVEAFDENGRAVTALPKWSVSPRGAGTIGESDGSFAPSPNFVGMARIAASVGGMRPEYTDPGEELPGQRVNYRLRRNRTGADTANTLMGMRTVFGPGVVKEGVGANSFLKVTVPQLNNHVYKGTENYRMADSAAFELSVKDTGAVTGDIMLAFDIPQMLKSAAGGGGYEFRVARWFPDSLKWIPTDSTRVSGGVVYTWLSRASAEGPSRFKRRKASARQVSRASAFTGSGLYALVVKTSKTSLAMTVSPHPFSPYIRPVIEHGPDAPAGTCINVNIQAPDPFVKSVKVRIHNVTGKMVWGVEKLDAETGDNKFWWNGRTSGRGSSAAVSEVVWSDDYYKSEEYRSRPLCRNGRYYVMVIMTDMDGKQMRAVKPLVLMK